MSRLITAIALSTVLAGCDSSNPFEGGDVIVDGDTPIIDDGEVVSSNGIPAALSGTGGSVNLEAVAFDPDANTLSVDINSLDSETGEGDIPLTEYAFNQNLTDLAPGYQVFSFQDDAADRMFVALVAQSEDGSVLGAVVMDGGQFGRFFGGGFYATDGNYTPGVAANDTGLVSYAGTYAGLTNLNANGDELLPLPGGTLNPAGTPDQPAQITGDVFINADFGDNAINGGVFNREFVNLDADVEAQIGGTELEDINLIVTGIEEDGTFFGTVENTALEGIGSYGGTFGGTEAAGVAGVVALDGDFIPGIDEEAEFGVFVLDQCGQPGDAAVCDAIPVNPNP